MSTRSDSRGVAAPAVALPKTVTFSYEAVTVDGKKFTGNMRAASPEDVQALLSARGIQVLKIRKPRGGLAKMLTPEPRKVKSQEIILFCRQLAMFVSVGIPITTGLQTIGEQSTSARLRSACMEMIAELGRGTRLSDAMRAHPSVFPSIVADMVRASEITGNLDKVLRDASKHIEREASAKQRVKSAMIYPAIIVTVALLLTIGITLFVLPRFRDLYASLGVPLPGVVKFVLAISDFVTSHALLIVLGILLAIVAASWWLRTESGRMFRDRLFLRIPLISPVLKSALTERFCRTFGDMLAAGVPISQTFTATIDAMGNRVYANSLRKVMASMTAGDGVFVPLRAANLFSPMVLQMVRVGEETGSLDSHLHEAAVMNGEMLDYRIKRLTSIIEPALIVFVGALVGFIAVTMISAIYSLAGGFH